MPGSATPIAADANPSADRLPQAIKTVVPQTLFPMKWDNYNGRVLVAFIVTAEGNVAQAKVKNSTDWDYSQAALDAIERWKFSPATKNGVAVESRVEMVFNFRMEDQLDASPKPMVADASKR
jgi:protein TonB